MAKRVDTRFEASENVSKVAKKAAGGVTGLNKSVKDTQKAFRNSTIAIGAAVAAIYGISRAVGSLIQRYQEQEQAETKLAAALKATGGAVGITKDEMIAYAKELQSVTTFGDEALINAQALMTTFTQVGKEVFPTAIEAAADMSAMFGQDLQQSVIQLGTALNDPIAGVGRLRRIGISFTEEQKEQIRVLTEAGDTMGAQTVILEELEREFGGVARAAGDTATGAIEQLKNAISDLQQVGGGAIAEFLQPWIEGFTEFVQKISESLERIRSLRRAAEQLGVIEKEGTEAISDKVQALEDQKTLYQQLQTQIDGLEQREGLFLNKLFGATKGIREYRDELIQQQKAIQENIAELEKQIIAEEEIREASAKDREELEKRLKAQEEANKYTNERIRIQTELINQFAVIDEMEKLWGDSIDVVKEKQKAVNAALKEMIEFGFSAGGAGIQKIVEMFGEWVSGTDEVKSKTKDLREEEQRQAEKRKEFFIAQLPELNQRIYWINTEKEAFIKAGIDRVEAETWAQEEIDQIREEHHQKELERQKEGAQVLISAVSSMVSSITSIWNQAYQNQETALKNDYQRRKKAIEANITDEEQRTAALENLDREYDQKRAELQTKQAKADKAAALLQAIVNTAAAIVEALPNIPLAILVGALGAIQIGVIAAQPIPKFAAGVRDFVVPPGYPNDSYPIMVESGERVSVTSAAATGSSEMIRNTIILDGRVIADYVTEAIRDRQIVVDAGAVR